MAYIATRAGNIRHPVTIQRATETASDTGEISRSWSFWAAWHAQVEPISERVMERLAGAQLQPEITHIVRMRFLDGLRTKDRILHRNRVLEIIGLGNLDEKDRVHELFCKEVMT